MMDDRVYHDQLWCIVTSDLPINDRLQLAREFVAEHGDHFDTRGVVRVMSQAVYQDDLSVVKIVSELFRPRSLSPYGLWRVDRDDSGNGRHRSRCSIIRYAMEQPWNCTTMTFRTALDHASNLHLNGLKANFTYLGEAIKYPGGRDAMIRAVNEIYGSAGTAPRMLSPPAIRFIVLNRLSTPSRALRFIWLLYGYNTDPSWHRCIDDDVMDRVVLGDKDHDIDMSGIAVTNEHGRNIRRLYRAHTSADIKDYRDEAMRARLLLAIVHRLVRVTRNKISFRYPRVGKTAAYETIAYNALDAAILSACNDLPRLWRAMGFAPPRSVSREKKGPGLRDIVLALLDESEERPGRLFRGLARVLPYHSKYMARAALSMLSSPVFAELLYRLASVRRVVSLYMRVRAIQRCMPMDVQCVVFEYMGNE